MLRAKANVKKNLNIIFTLLDNKLYLRYQGLFNSFFLPSKATFISLMTDSYRILNLIFFVTGFSKAYQLFRFFYAFSHIINGRSLQTTGFYRIMDLVGLGFRITRITKSIFLFDIGYATGIYFFVPSDIEVFYSPSMKKLIVFSVDAEAVSSTIASLLLLRGPHIYKVRGFIDVKTIVRLRTGKQR